MTLAWFFKEERTPATDAVLQQVAKAGAMVPALWPLEVGNVLQLAVRKQRVNAAFRDATLADLQAMTIEIDAHTCDHAWKATIALSERHRLTVYDASYLELAVRTGLPLASLDKELRQAATALQVPLLGMAAGA